MQLLKIKNEINNISDKINERELVNGKVGLRRPQIVAVR